MLCSPLLISGVLALGSSPWDKYMLAPGPDRTQVPTHWVHTPAGEEPPQPSNSGCVGGSVPEWMGVPGTAGAQQTLSCGGAGSTIAAVAFASWGKPSGACGAFEKGNCDAPNTTAWVESLCVGKSSCTLPPDATVRGGLSPLDQALGDPCPGVVKKLSVQLSCSSPPPPPTPAPPPSLPIRLSGKGDQLLFDWGRETGGFTTLSFGGASDAAQSVSLAYSEASYYWTGGDHSNGGKGPDGTISTGPIAPNGSYTPPAAHMRGGFRYLNLVLETDGWVDVLLPSVHFTAAPNMPDPSAWANHFYSSDETLNEVWYGCGYTTQMCSIDPAHGRQWPAPKSGWNNSAQCGLPDGSLKTVLVDGAKRDRVIWPGDMGVSSLTAIATTGDLEASRGALETLYHYQKADGMLPYAGPPVSFFGNSDTYHLWALLGTYNIATHEAAGGAGSSGATAGNGTAWLASVWDGFVAALAASTAKVSAASGLFGVTAAADWARQDQGGENCPANMLYFKALRAGAELAAMLGHGALAAEFLAMAAASRAAILAGLWDEGKGAFFDNPGKKTLFPQDGNALALWFNVTADAPQAARVSDYLASNWGPFGSSSPEWEGGSGVGTFPGSMEVHAHMAAGDAQRAHDLIRLQWGYMLHHPQGTRSTFWEGYNTDGTFAYQGIYMSNAHGWATGPAAALTFGTLGIRPAGAGAGGGGSGHRGSMAFAVAPLFGDLEHCQGRLAFGAPGVYVGAAWNVSATAVTLAVDSATMPRAARGTVTVDLAGLASRRHRQKQQQQQQQQPSHAPRTPLAAVTVNGVRVWRRGAGMLCATAEACGLGTAAAGAIDVSGVVGAGAAGVVEVREVQPQQSLVIELAFA